MKTNYNKLLIILSMAFISLGLTACNSGSGVVNKLPASNISDLKKSMSTGEYVIPGFANVGNITLDFDQNENLMITYLDKAEDKLLHLQYDAKSDKWVRFDPEIYHIDVDHVFGNKYLADIINGQKIYGQSFSHLENKQIKTSLLSDDYQMGLHDYFGANNVNNFVIKYSSYDDRIFTAFTDNDSINIKYAHTKYDGSLSVFKANIPTNINPEHLFSFDVGSNTNYMYLAYIDHKTKQVLFFDSKDKHTYVVSNNLANDVSVNYHLYGPLIGYSDTRNAGRLVVKKCVNYKECTFVGNESGISAGEAKSITVAYSASGVPFVSYLENGELIIKKFKDNSWTSVKTIKANSTTGIINPQIKFNTDEYAPGNMLYLTYIDGDQLHISSIDTTK